MGRTDQTSVGITICMGSSCYARGNGANLELIESYIEEKGVAAQVTLTGSRCEGACAAGPSVSIGGTRYGHVDREMLLDLLEETFGSQREAHE